MSDQNQESGEQRRREILTQARKTLERVKDIAERRDEPLPSPPDRVAEWRTRAEQHAAKCAQAKAELQLPSILEQLELRLTEERALILDVIGEALAAQRDFVRELIGQEGSKRESHATEVNAEFQRINAQFQRVWTSLSAEHSALVDIQKERRDAEIAASERPAAKAKLN